jgi:hypothetical protein
MAKPDFAASGLNENFGVEQDSHSTRMCKVRFPCDLKPLVKKCKPVSRTSWRGTVLILPIEERHEPKLFAAAISLVANRRNRSASSLEYLLVVSSQKAPIRPAAQYHIHPLRRSPARLLRIHGQAEISADAQF